MLIKNDQQIISETKRQDLTSKHAGAFGTVKNSSKTEISRISINATKILQINIKSNAMNRSAKTIMKYAKDLGIRSNLKR